MEPRNDEPKKAPEPPKEEKQRKRRFQIVKLEERIAPCASCTDRGCGGHHVNTHNPRAC
jgi:hypothetical protein